MGCIQKIADPDVLVWQLVSYIIRHILHGHKGIPVLSDELLEGKIALTLPHASVN